MPPRVKRTVIDISDDDEPRDATQVEAKKRKPKAEPLEEKVQWTDSDDGPTKPKESKAKRKRRSCREQRRDENSDIDGLNAAGIPDYLQQRRLNFEANKRQQHEAALMLPPDYLGLDLGTRPRPGQARTKPEFGAASGIKPSRTKQDIHLPLTGGIIPASVAQYLRDYQVVGVEFLHQKFVHQQGGILGDDMGLGKTVQVAAFLSTAFGMTGDERDARRMREMRFCSQRWYPRIMIICPGSLIMNWRNELDRWGWWHVEVFHGANKDDVLGTARSGLLEIMITTYDTYKNSRSAVNMVQWDAVIADECHRLKDHHSETTKAMLEVNALCRIGLTGTAIQNRYEELWTLLDWTHPGYFGTRAEWKRSISRPLSVGQSHDANLAQLKLARLTAQKLVQNLLPRFFLRRMKTLIAHQLPKKMDRVVFCPLTDLQRQAYQTFLTSPDMRLIRSLSNTCEHGKSKGWCCHKYTASGARWQNIVFPSMIVLQKLANHLTLLVPMTTDMEQKHQSELETLKICVPDQWKSLYQHRDQIRNLVDAEFCGKWKVMRKLLRFWHGNGDKVLVFSHSVRLLRILQHLMANTSYTVSYLDGSLSYEERQRVVDEFNSDPTRFVFLISTKAGGTGLNITSANKVVIVDPHWNPSYDLQAQDRAYRIGQTRDVEVFRLISTGTVEEIVYARQIYKQQQANIGYTASSERRYFKGVQQDSERKGEIFGLSNIFTYHSESGLLRDIVNKTNIAEAKAGVRLAEVNMEQVARDADILQELDQAGHTDKVKVEGEGEADDDDNGIGQLATLLTGENQNKSPPLHHATTPPKTDAVQAILMSVGVEYSHHNSEVVGTSRVEEQLSRRATMDDGSSGGQGVLFADTESEDTSDDRHDEEQHAAPYSVYRPPQDVCLRHFCEMARDFGASPTDFALLVESWTTEMRRDYLDLFYQRREAAHRAGSETASGQHGEVKTEDRSEEQGREGSPTTMCDGMVKMEEATARGSVMNDFVWVKTEDVETRGMLETDASASIKKEERCDEKTWIKKAETCSEKDEKLGSKTGLGPELKEKRPCPKTTTSQREREDIFSLDTDDEL
ncbi:hypothetical protein CDD82_489 [Ophiocordyceps australis]|uniref:Uncharacterized protein n=1 Tax=Ophiocordyceps australis TaxID=1399860 RepID=A0A2C5ZP01_9HYPO|nr:hypothetical protein CDD82_489 [Ophiocordyceps australis]